MTAAAMPHAVLVRVNNPFAPMRDREVRALSARGQIRACAPQTRRPFIIQRNGVSVLRKDWDQPVERGDIITVVVLPQGGGGGSNPLRIVLMLAVAFFAPYAAGFLNSALGLGLGVSGMSVLTGAIGLVGNMLVNALIPPPKPPTPQQAQSLASPSPTYNLQAQGNMARLDSAIPAHYGRMIAYPDFAAMPYAEYAGNEQYLYQLFCLGQGYYDIEAVRIEDTPIANFEEIEYEVVPPGGSVRLFPSNVITSVEVAGQEAAGKVTGATYDQPGTTTITVTKTAHGFAVGKQVYLDFTSGTAPDGGYIIDTVPTANTFTVVAAASATTSGNVEIQPYLGPFTANAATTQANTIGIDIILPRGLYYANANGGLDAVTISWAVELRKIDDAGAPVGSWAVVGSESLNLSTTTPQRYSYRYGVTSGRYEARLRRTNTKQTDAKYGNDLVWGGLRAYLPDNRQYGAVTLIAMRMKASNNLSQQASRKVNVIATRKLRTWNGTGWTAPAATRSIAWAFADAAQNTIYGGRLADNRIDLAGLLALHNTWESRGDHFDARFDNTLALWEALSKIAAAGRARPFMQGGILYVARDQSNTLPVALYSMRNIIRGSFNIEYIMPSEDTADAVEVSYFDKVAWQPRRVPAALAGSASANKAKIDLFGVVDREHAYREGLYQAASNKYRRRLIKFSTEMEGFIPALLDPIAIQHDMPQWGQFAEAVAWDAANKVLTLSEPLAWTAGQTHYIGLRAKDGGLEGPITVTPGTSDYQVVLDTVPTNTPYTGSDYERTHVVFGWGETWRQPARVISVTPRGLHQVEILAVNEDASVHTADVGVTAPAVSSSQLSNLYTTPVVLGLTVRSSSSDVNAMLLSWQPAQGADHYLIEQSSGDGTWTRCGDTAAANFVARAIYGNSTFLRVAAVGMTRGPWVTVSYASGADYMWAANDADLMWNATDTTLMWK